MNPTLLKLTKARTALILQQPFFGTLALRLKFKIDPDCKTAWTDGITQGYNPDFVDRLSMDETKGLICHEVMHVANLHHLRQGQREGKRWNQAGDYAINGLITGAGMQLPQGGLINPAFNGMASEHIYNMLPPTPPGGGGPGEGNDPGGCGEVRPYPGQDPALEEQQTKIAVQQAAQAAKAQGKLPADLARLVQDITESKVDWREALHRFVSQAAHADYSFRKPNRRFTGCGIFLPSLYSEELPPIAAAVDTSGSVDDTMVKQYGGELDGVLTQYPTTINVLYCDAAVQGEEVFTRDNQPLVLNAKGGGGTDFRPVFDRIATWDEQPCCLIFLTDLMGTFPKEAPDYPVMWITDGNLTAPFGETIKY